MKSQSKYCKQCGQVLAHKDERDIGCMAHFGFALITAFITLLTGGIGLIPMMIIWFMSACYDNSKWRCSRCGEVVK